MKTGLLRHSIVIGTGLLIGLILPCLSAFAGGAPHAFVNQSALKTRAMAPVAKPVKKADESGLSGSVSLSYSQNLVDYQDGEKSTSGYVSVGLSGDITSTWNLSGGISFSQDLKDAESDSNGVSDLSIGLGHNASELASWLTGKWSISGYYPLSEYSVKVQNFQGSIGTRYRFSLTQAVLPKGMSLSTSLSGSRSFYKYETDATGKILSPYSIRESLSVGYDIRRWDFSASFSHAHRFNFENRVSQSFELGQEIGYSILPKVWNVAVGHTNSGSWLKSNEQDSNLELINENDSFVYVQTELSF